MTDLNTHFGSFRRHIVGHLQPFQTPYGEKAIVYADWTASGRLYEPIGIQARGGCSCAGTYGHYLLNVDRYQSRRITDRIDQGDLSAKPGWVRLSAHPTTTDSELEYILDALRQIRAKADRWAAEYRYDPQTNEFLYRGPNERLQEMAEEWFTLA